MREAVEALSGPSEAKSETQALREGIGYCREGRMNRTSGYWQADTDWDYGQSHFDGTPNVGASWMGAAFSGDHRPEKINMVRHLVWNISLANFLANYSTSKLKYK
jgi:hypothetical protein